jgi:hypothetical protein
MRLAGTACAAAALSLAACSGGVSTTDTPGAVPFTVGGTVTGLAGAGLVLQNNGGDSLKVPASGSFVFPTTLITGNSYLVSVSSQPTSPDQTCVVANGSGIVADGNITTIAIQCANKTSATDTIGGIALGILGSGLVLQDNAGDNLTVSSNGTFTFPTPLASGMPFLVTVLSPPINPYQDCIVTNAAGTTGGDNVTDLTILCKTNSNPTYTISGTVSGISPSQPLMLQDNGRDTITLSASGRFSFPLAIPSGSSYNVTLAATTGQQSQTCTFANASGTVSGADVTNVSVACVANESVKVSVSGLQGSGLVLQDNGQDDLSVAGNGTSTFPAAVATGASYRITVLTQPTNPSQMCSVANGSGTVGAGDVTGVQVTCVTQAYTVGGTVSNLLGTGLSLVDNHGTAYPIIGTGTVPFTLPGTVASGTRYAVTVATQPVNPSQMCTVMNGSGTVGAADVTTVQVSCVTQAFTIGGVVTNLQGTGLSLVDNAGNPYHITGTGTVPFTLPGTVLSGARYAVTVAAQPLAPSQICTIPNGSGTVGAGNVTGIQVTCVTQKFQVGGTLTRYLAPPETGMVLNDGVETLTPPADATTFIFPTAIASGQKYAVTIETQPTGQSCQLTDGTGTVGASPVTSVQVSCTYWEWIAGNATSASPGVYGTPGTAAPTNLPGGREGGATWTDAAGNLWLFGGYGLDSTNGQYGYLSDLWEYKTSTNEWTWIGGSSTSDTASTYGTLGTAAAGNAPGGRYLSVSWIDGAGNLWLFGGYGMSVGGGDSDEDIGDLNDLWKYDPSTKLWTWMGGYQAANMAGVYGTQNIAAGTNLPGARDSAISWVDNSGNLWLFGGYGYIATTSGELNDLWKYSATSGLWTWVSGSSTVTDASGVYGTKGTAAPGNVPGARENAVSWVDTSGNLWLFGGAYTTYPAEAASITHQQNDLWRFNTTSSLWTYMSGSTTPQAAGVYGTEGVPAAANVPGARDTSSSWVDAAGNFWLFGGNVMVTLPGIPTVTTQIDDLWEYVPGTNQWTWIAGSNAARAAAAYGTKGVPAVSTTPGARSDCMRWTDAAGNLWLFGGYPINEPADAEIPEYPNDLWKFVPFTLAP